MQKHMYREKARELFLLPTIRTGISKKRTLALAGALASTGVLLLSLAHPAISSATVPGVNEGIDVNTGGASANSSSGSSSISLDGRYVAFTSLATDLTSDSLSGTFMRVYVRDRRTDTTTLVSKSTGGAIADAYSQNVKISADGRYVVFASNATNLVASISGGPNVYIRDLVAGTTQLVSADSSGNVANNESGRPSVSADGRYVVFMSLATNLVASPSLSGSSTHYIYRKDMVTGNVKLLSISITGTAPNAESTTPLISCDGRFAEFYSDASNLVSGDTNAHGDVFTYDLLADSVKNVTLSSNDLSVASALSCNGDYVLFRSLATNITADTVNGSSLHLFLYDNINNTYTLVSKATGGTIANADSGDASISDDGRYVAFDSSATNLVASDANGKSDIFLRDLLADTTEIVSVNSGGTKGNGDSFAPMITANAQYVAYASLSTNLVSGFGNTNGSIYASKTGVVNDY